MSLKSIKAGALSCTASPVWWATVAMVVSILSRPGAAMIIESEGCGNGQCGKFCQTDEVGTAKLYSIIGVKWGDVASIWGSGPYLAESLVDEATVHAGVLTHGENGIIKITCVAEPDRYLAGTDNGVITRPVDENGQYKVPKVDAPKGAYTVELATSVVTPAPTELTAAPTLKPTPPPPTPTAEPTPVTTTPKPTSKSKPTSKPTPKSTPKSTPKDEGDEVETDKGRGQEGATNGKSVDDADDENGFVEAIPIILTTCLLMCVLFVACFLYYDTTTREAKMLDGQWGTLSHDNETEAAADNAWSQVSSSSGPPSSTADDSSSAGPSSSSNSNCSESMFI